MKSYVKSASARMASHYQPESKEPLSDSGVEVYHETQITSVVNHGNQTIQPEMQEASQTCSESGFWLREIRKEVKKLNKKADDITVEKEVEDDWKCVAAVADRLFLVIAMIAYASAVYLMYSETG